MNINIGRVIVAINGTLDGNANAAIGMRALIDANTAHADGILVNAVSFDFQSSTEYISSDIFAIMNILAGKRPDVSPFFSAAFDPIIPISNLLPSSSDNSSPFASIGVQASEFVKMCVVIKQDIFNAAQQCEEYKNVSRDSGCTSCANTTTIQTLIEAWNNTCVKIEQHVNVTITNGTLIAQVNSTIGGNITAAINATNNFLVEMKNCSQCLVQEFKSSRSKMFKKCITGSSGSGSGAGSGEKTCADRQKESAKKFAKACQVHMKNKRKHAQRRRTGFKNKAQSVASSVIAVMDQTLVNFSSVINVIFASTLKDTFQALSITMGGFRATIEVLLSILINTVAVSINASQNILNGTLANATEQVFNGCKNFTDQVAGDSDLYPTCQHFGNATLQIQANFSLNIESVCMAPADNKTENATAIAGIIIANLTGNWQNIMSESDNCYSTCAASGSIGLCLNLWRILFGPTWVSCLNKVFMLLLNI